MDPLLQFAKRASVALSEPPSSSAARSYSHDGVLAVVQEASSDSNNPDVRRNDLAVDMPGQMVMSPSSKPASAPLNVKLKLDLSSVRCKMVSILFSDIL
jgi:hypothetical protein